MSSLESRADQTSLYNIRLRYTGHILCSTRLHPPSFLPPSPLGQPQPPFGWQEEAACCRRGWAVQWPHHYEKNCTETETSWIKSDVSITLTVPPMASLPLDQDLAYFSFWAHLKKRVQHWVSCADDGHRHDVFGVYLCSVVFSARRGFDGLRHWK